MCGGGGGGDYCVCAGMHLKLVFAGVHFCTCARMPRVRACVRVHECISVGVRTCVPCLHVCLRVWMCG